ncbi:MAG: hypothetical protein HDS75_07340 [Bacteroidales bacterium]|nr:hypothetical protein [Bacteroidales bacterium]MDE6801944.1 hypothetical protein [Muribaculaceae bacterium]
MDLSSLSGALETAKDKINETGIPEKVVNAVNTAKDKINESGVPDKVKSAAANGLDKVAEVAENLAGKLRHDDDADV